MNAITEYVAKHTKHCNPVNLLKPLFQQRTNRSIIYPVYQCFLMFITTGTNFYD